MNRLQCALFLGLSVFALTASADPTAYLVDNADDFGTLDLNTGVFTLIGTLSPFPNGPIPPHTGSGNIVGMGFAPNGTLYAADNANPSNFYIVNPATAGITMQGPLGGYDSGGSTVGPDGLIYSVAFNGNAPFYTVDPATLASHIINPTTGILSSGLAVIDSGEFYAEDLSVGNEEHLEQISLLSGQVTQVGDGLGFNATAGTTVGNTVYAVGVTNSIPNVPLLETIDTTTGTATLVADITGLLPNTFPLAVAYDNYSSVPEPSSVWLDGIGLAAAIAFWYRRAFLNASSRC